jgi:hypothetical protein
MPYLRMPPTIDDAYNANTKAQYEALGRFVEAFEAMVNETRSASISILSRASAHANLLDVVFHHSALSAKPLFEIMRALVADFLKQPSLKVAIKDRDTFFGVMADIATEYSHLANTRNSLLHGTWYVGFISYDNPNADNFILNKYKPTKGGLSKEESLPTDAFELLALTDRCRKTRNWIAFVQSCLPLSYQHDIIAETFQFMNGRWHLTFKDTTSETLP